MKRNLAAGLTFALLGLLAVPALAQEQPADEEGGYGAIVYLLTHPRVLARQVGLNATQAASARTLIQSTGNALKPVKDEVASLTRQIADALAQPAPDTCAVGGLVVDRRDTAAQVQQILDNFDDAFAALLTPEQLAKYEALKDRLTRDSRKP